MNEKDFVRNLRPWLDRSADGVGELQATRLRSARLRALDEWHEPVRLLGVVTIGAGTVQTLRYSILQQGLVEGQVVELEAYENRLLLAGARPAPAATARALRHHLRAIGSDQAVGLRVRRLRPAGRSG